MRPILAKAATLCRRPNFTRQGSQVDWIGIALVRVASGAASMFANHQKKSGYAVLDRFEGSVIEHTCIAFHPVRRFLHDRLCTDA